MSEQANGPASDPVFTSGFLIILDLSPRDFPSDSQRYAMVNSQSKKKEREREKERRRREEGEMQMSISCQKQIDLGRIAH